MAAPLAACGGGGGGYKDADKLAASVKEEANKQIREGGSNTSTSSEVTDVSCVQGESDRAFTCILKVKGGNGPSETHDVAVSPDGKNYIVK